MFCRITATQNPTLESKELIDLLDFSNRQLGFRLLDAQVTTEEPDRNSKRWNQDRNDKLTQADQFRVGKTGNIGEDFPQHKPDSNQNQNGEHKSLR